MNEALLDDLHSKEKFILRTLAIKRIELILFLLVGISIIWHLMSFIFHTGTIYSNIFFRDTLFFLCFSVIISFYPLWWKVTSSNLDKKLSHRRVFKKIGLLLFKVSYYLSWFTFVISILILLGGCFFMQNDFHIYESMLKFFNIAMFAFSGGVSILYLRITSDRLTKSPV